GGRRGHPNNPPVAQTPGVGVHFIRSSPQYDRCFTASETPTSPLTMFWQVSVVGGPPGVGTLSVNAGGQIQLGTAYPGYSRAFQFGGLAVTVGSSITCTANYTINGVTYSGSGA